MLNGKGGGPLLVHLFHPGKNLRQATQKSNGAFHESVYACLGRGGPKLVVGSAMEGAVVE